MPKDWSARKVADFSDRWMPKDWSARKVADFSDKRMPRDWSAGKVADFSDKRLNRASPKKTDARGRPEIRPTKWPVALQYRNFQSTAERLNECRDRRFSSCCG
jgi:hypothetical protein